MNIYAIVLVTLLAFNSLCCSEPISLKVIEREIQVNNKPAKVLGIVKPDGSMGITLNKGQVFDVNLQNELNVPTSIHWHGIILPNKEDGVAFVTQFPIYPRTSYRYQYPLLQAGTFFMHSHFSLQEQQLLSAPLILREPEDDRISDREVVILLADFSFKSPEEIYQSLRCNKSMSMQGSSHEKMKMGPDVVDVVYDAFLANYRTLEDPEVFNVKPGDRVRLRIINAASATNFFINLGELEGNAIAVDGNRIQPLTDHQFELGVAQRIDVLVTIPSGGIFPILAQGEGTKMQTGIVLKANDKPEKISLPSLTAKPAGVIGNKQELKLRALSPLANREISNKVTLELGGDMANYVWTINGQTWPEATPVLVKDGERVEITFKNITAMSHPMHLHGHVFEVTEIDGQSFKGAVRDTVLVGPGSTVKIQFDANNPGVWPLHCHLLYHLEAGMMTVVRYADFIQPL